MKKGFTILELLIVLGIMALLVGVIFSAFINVRKGNALQNDTDVIVETLRQARSQTLSSQNQMQYGVHLASTQITLFTGASYSAGNATNQNIPLNASDTVLTITLVGGGSDVVFARLSGETTQSGTVVLSSSSTGKTKTITIYKTGIIEVQ